MFAHIRVLILAALAVVGLLATSGDAQAQHRRVYSGVYYGGYNTPSYSYTPGYYHGGVYPAGYSYYATPSYVSPASGSSYSGATFYLPTVWHAGTVYPPLLPRHLLPRRPGVLPGRRVLPQLHHPPLSQWSPRTGGVVRPCLPLITRRPR